MRTKALIAVAVAVMIGAAYLAGSVPERSLRDAAEAQVATLETRLAAAEARVRAGQLLGQALTLKEIAMRQNYGQALEMSSGFFDAIRAEAAAQSADPGLQQELQQVLAMRDRVTATLAKADPGLVDALHDVELRLRRALRYPLPPEPAVVPPAPEPLPSAPAPVPQAPAAAPSAPPSRPGTDKPL